MSAARLCVVVPYRDRAGHLAAFVPHVRDFLTAQGVAFTLLVVEQADARPFNRAKLLNVGFAAGLADHEYFCFHDVDMLPVSADYSRCERPTHLAAEIEQFDWGLPYESYFGGVTLFDRESFLRVNGYPNEYWGWGCEDDDLYKRCRKLGLLPQRRRGRFRSLAHERVIDRASYRRNLEKLSRFETTFDGQGFVGGLSTLRFETVSQTNPEPGVTHLSVRL